MSSSVMILSLFYVWISCSMMDTMTKSYFNRENWFGQGNIFHIEQEDFRTTFQQHRNVNRHIHWLSNEISSLNRQIKSIKDQVTFVIQQEETNPPLESNKTSRQFSSPRIQLKNERNIFILKLLVDEILFEGYLEELIDIYEVTPITMVIECIAVLIDKDSIGKHLLIKLVNGNIDRYHMNQSKSLRETFWKLNRTILVWNNDGKKPEYYRRFIHNPKIHEMMTTDQLTDMKNRPKLVNANFFDLMGQILRIKYHTDPSSLSCILEVFFADIYTCDGRLIHPHELKLLSDDHDFFVFYAVMMDTRTEKQIYPLDTNNHIRHGDQIFFLFQTHPQFQSLSTLSCPECSRNEHTYLLKDNVKEVEPKKDSHIVESKPPPDNIVGNSLLSIPQNYIVYAILTSILIYILIGIYLSRKEQQESSGNFERKHLISSRRGR